MAKIETNIIVGVTCLTKHQALKMNIVQTAQTSFVGKIDTSRQSREWIQKRKSVLSRIWIFSPEFSKDRNKIEVGILFEFSKNRNKIEFGILVEFSKIELRSKIGVFSNFRKIEIKSKFEFWSNFQKSK